MKRFKELVRETAVEPDVPSQAAMTYKEKPNKEPMPKLKEEKVEQIDELSKNLIKKTIYSAHDKSLEAQKSGNYKLSKNKLNQAERLQTKYNEKNKSMKEETDTTEKVEMVQSQLHFIKYACEEILEYIDDGGEIEEWYQVKVAKSFSEFESLHAFIEGESRRTGMKEETEKFPFVAVHAKKGMHQTHGRTSYEAAQNAAKHWKMKSTAGIDVHRADKKHVATESVELDEKIDVIRGAAPRGYHGQIGNTVRRVKMPTGQTVATGRHYTQQKPPKVQQEELEYLDENIIRKLIDWWKNLGSDEKEETMSKINKSSSKSSGSSSQSVSTQSKSSGSVSKSSASQAGETLQKWGSKQRNEEVEQIDELSNELLGRYKDKAVISHGEAEKAKDYKLSDKRFSGVVKATNKQFDNARKKPFKLGEETEQLDEISAETKASYTQKATKEVEQLKPHAEKGEYKDIAKNIITRRQKGIAMAKEQKEEPPFTPDPPKKKQVVPGKYGSGYSTARHLARQALKKQTEKLKPVKESLEESRKTEIVKEIMKKKKNDKENTDTFQKEPVLSSEIVKA